MIYSPRGVLVELVETPQQFYNDVLQVVIRTAQTAESGSYAVEEVILSYMAQLAFGTRVALQLTTAPRTTGI